jgi:hypothetical protein
MTEGGREMDGGREIDGGLEIDEGRERFCGVATEDWLPVLPAAMLATLGVRRPLPIPTEEAAGVLRSREELRDELRKAREGAVVGGGSGRGCEGGGTGEEIERFRGRVGWATG